MGFETSHSIFRNSDRSEVWLQDTVKLEDGDVRWLSATGKWTLDRLWSVVFDMEALIDLVSWLYIVSEALYSPLSRIAYRLPK